MATHYAVNPQTGERLALVNGRWVPATPAGQSSGAPRLTEAQAKDGFNAKRMSGAAEVVNSLEDQGFDAGRAAIVPGFLPGTDDKRRYEAAENEWADALLRTTTGAAATKDEIRNARKTYFPEFGDSPEVRKQKAAMRARVEQDAKSRAGPAAMGSASPQGGQAAKSYSPAQRKTADRLLAQNPNMRSLRPGTQGRPYAPTSAAEFHKIKPGEWYVDDDGQIYQKGR